MGSREAIRIKNGKEGDNEGHARLEGLQGRGGVSVTTQFLEFYHAPRIRSRVLRRSLTNQENSQVRVCSGPVDLGTQSPWRTWVSSSHTPDNWNQVNYLTVCN